MFLFISPCNFQVTRMILIRWNRFRPLMCGAWRPNWKCFLKRWAVRETPWMGRFFFQTKCNMNLMKLVDYYTLRIHIGPLRKGFSVYSYSGEGVGSLNPIEKGGVRILRDIILIVFLVVFMLRWIFKEKIRMFPKLVVPGKSSILIGISIINHPYFRYPYFWKQPYQSHEATWRIISQLVSEVLDSWGWIGPLP